MAKVVIFGVGQNAEVAFTYLTHDSEHEIVAFTLDAEYINSERHFDLPVIPFDSITEHYPPAEYKMFVPISFTQVNQLRAKKYYEAKQKGYQFISYISSNIQSWPDLSVGENCFILEQNVIQPFVEIGNNVVIWSANHIGHHSIIKDHCFIASHVVISGSVRIEPYCFLGVNATVRDNIIIARENVIGAGALILNDTKEKEVYMGHPAQLATKFSDELKRI